MSATPPGFFATVGLLLGAARQRERGRLAARTRHRRNPYLLLAFATFGMLLLQFGIAYTYSLLTNAAAEAAIEADGKLAVTAYLLEQVQGVRDAEAKYRRATGERPAADASAPIPRGAAETAERELASARDDLQHWLKHEAIWLKQQRGRDNAYWRGELERRYAHDRGESFVESPMRRSGLAATGFPILTALLVLWWLSLALQGENLGFDVMRRRHPMWEWYLGFPVSNAAVFVAEALAPIAANPVLTTAPVMLAILAGIYEQSVGAGLAALPVGVPLVVTAAVWNKAIEVAIMLRSKPRNRGVWIATLSGMGLFALVAPFLLVGAPPLMRLSIDAVRPWLGHMPGPAVLLGTGSVGGWFAAMATSVIISALLLLPAVALLRSATGRGLEGGFGDDSAVDHGQSFATSGRGRFFDDPLWRKDLLWLRRDRGALFQLVAMPLALAALQLFNLNNVLRDAELSWHRVAGVVVGFGAYLLFLAGPRALASEGPALVLTLSWPRSLEDTLRMKVRLLFSIVSAMVYLCFAVLVWMFPRDALGIVLVAVAWPLFGLAVAEKSVTLVRAPNQSGEVERLPQARLWVAGLGNLAFAIGVFNAQWNIAIAAIVLNWVFAGALWQGFRHHLPYLFDPGSEPALRPPTVLSSAVAIVGLMELGVVISVPVLIALGPEGAQFAQAIGYGIAALCVVVVVNVWHAGHGVDAYDMLALDDRARRAPAGWCLLGIATGAALAAVAFGYERLLFELPWPALHDTLEHHRVFLRESPTAKLALFVLAVGFAPWVEEFLFRGLMFRAMLGEWGFARALLASSALFAILHAPPFWPMIFALGAASAFVYWRSRALLPCVLLHLTYNALVVAFS